MLIFYNAFIDGGLDATRNILPEVHRLASSRTIAKLGGFLAPTASIVSLGPRSA